LDGRKTQAVAWLGTPTKQAIVDEYKRKIAQVMLYPVNAYDVKTEVMAGLANLVLGKDANGKWPRNTFQIAADLCDDDLALELTAERLVDPEEELKKSVNRRSSDLIDPRAKKEWKKISGRKNDWFDVSVYGFAIAWYLETKLRLNQERWSNLLLDVHGQPVTPDLFTVAAEDPFHKKEAPKMSLAELSKTLNK
jgi:phage terminase large subunit GpA-like protein